MIAVDFSKVFDSVDRQILVRALKEYRCNKKIIDVIADLYQEDETVVYRYGRRLGGVVIANGIRQGCMGSPLLFKMVTNRIIKKLVQSGLGYRDNDLYIPALFFADKGLLLAQNRGEMEGLLRVLEETSKECSLSLNRQKSQVVVFNGEDTCPDVAGIRVNKGETPINNFCSK